MFFFNTSYGQDREMFRDFKLNKPIQSIQNSLYNRINVIDLRTEKKNIGKIQIGILNKPFTLILNPSLSTQLTVLFNEVVTKATEQQELVFFLKKLYLYERTGALTEEGFCIYSAELYEKCDSNYYLIQSIDTISHIESVDVTKELLKTADSLISSTITYNLKKHGNKAVPLTYNEIVNADKIAKRKITVYNTNNYIDGVYLSFESFKNQTPDLIATVKKNKTRIKSVSILDANGLTKELQSKDIYAVITDGFPYIATQYGYYPMKFENDNFSFIAKLSAPAKSSIATGIMFGLAGTLVAAQINTNSYFFSIIDYRNGKIIRIREIPFGADE